MSNRSPNSHSKATVKVVAIYALFGLAWIYGSDTLLGWLVTDSAVMVKIAVMKGSLFIILTAALLYVLIHRLAGQLAVAEKAKIEGLRNYQAIFRTSPDSININRLADGVFIDVNEGFTSLLGYQREEVLGLSSTAVGIWVDPEDRARLAGEIEAKGELKNLEARLRRKDGSLLTALVSSRLIELDGGFCTLNIARDISERKRIEDALLYERNRAQGYLDTVETILVALDAQGRITTINRKACQILGYQEEELIGRSWFATCLPQPEGEEVIFPYFLEIIAGKLEGTEYLENPVVTRGGELRDVAWHNATLRDEEGHIFGTLSAGEDITDRKRAAMALKESNDRILSLVNTVPGQVAFVNAQTLRYEFVNLAFEKAFGIPREKIVGCSIRDIIGEENFRFAEKFIEEVRAGRAVSYENTFHLSSGKRWLKVNYTPIVDLSGHAVSIVVHSVDITDLKEHELERLKMEKLESLGILAGGIAHDFNNILTAIMGNISLAKTFVDDTHKAFSPLAGAEKASVRATELARQLLTFARGGEPVKKVVSVAHIVHESVSLVLHGSNVGTVVDVPDSVHAIEADEGQVSQVLHNIIINATQAMPGGGTLTVTAANETLAADNSLSLAPGPYVCLKVIDEGCGISSGEMGKIFDPYFTTKASGSGLGLASANSIVTKHLGHISVTSVVGKGTTFTIHLPSIGETYSEYQTETASRFAGFLPGGSVLVMDDEEMIRELAIGMLEELGYRVATCASGKEAIELYLAAQKSEVPYVAVIMDLTIPGGMGGKEAAEALLALDPDACLIVSTGYSNDPIMSSYERYGFSAAITKPYTMGEMKKALATALRERGAP